MERYRDEIRKNIPEVDAVVGTGELESILSAAGLAALPAPRFNIAAGTEHHADARRRFRAIAPADAAASRAEGDLREQQGRFARDAWDGATPALPTYLYDETTPRLLATGKTSAYLKIAEGCDHPCSFCVIPNLRGKFRSRRFESVVAEAEQLVARGVREITLIGQDTTCYGEDFGLKDGLAALLDRLAQIEGLTWLRFLYAYPNKITGRLLDTIAKHDRIVKYLDVPLQHASAPVLKRMRRGANAEIFLKTLEKVRAAVPGIALRTSFIVGFPGETAEDHATLMDFVREAKFDWMGAFAYSDEEGSQSIALDKSLKVPEAHHRGAPPRADEAAAVDQPRAQATVDWPDDGHPGRRRERGDAAACGRAARSSTRRRSTARSTSTTSARTKRWCPAPSIARRSLKRTTTTWSRASSNKRNNVRSRYV